MLAVQGILRFLLKQTRYVLPSIGLGSILSKATSITNNMIYASGAALPDMLSSEEPAIGLLYPSLERIRDISVHVARNVIHAAQRDGVDRAPDLKALDDRTLDE
jgi:malate dehydrogenase (oxaloacetate-decarboxylating)(NADP+)